MLISKHLNIWKSRHDFLECSLLEYKVTQRPVTLSTGMWDTWQSHIVIWYISYITLWLIYHHNIINVHMTYSRNHKTITLYHKTERIWGTGSEYMCIGTCTHTHTHTHPRTGLAEALWPCRARELVGQETMQVRPSVIIWCGGQPQRVGRFFSLIFPATRSETLRLHLGCALHDRLWGLHGAPCILCHDQAGDSVRTWPCSQLVTSAGGLRSPEFQTGIWNRGTFKA